MTVEPPAPRPLWRRPGPWVLALLPVHALGYWALSAFPGLVERVYGRGFYPGFTWLRRWLDVTPLSPALTLGLLIVGGVAASSRGAPGRRRIAARCAWRLLVAAAVLVHLFPICWGFNYLRPSAAERLGLDLRVEKDAFAHTAGRVVEATDAARIPWEVHDPAALEREVDAAVLRLLGELGLDEAAFPRRIRFLPANLMLVGGWHGVTIPHTTEAWVDPGVDPRDLPLVIAHEKMHQAGFAREADANLLAWLALTRAPDPRLRYSALFYVVDLFAPYAPLKPSPQVRQDITQAIQTVQAVTVPAVEEATQKAYDTYLKANQVQAGVQDYDRVAGLIHAWLQLHPDWLDLPPLR